MNNELDFLEEKYGDNFWSNYPPSKEQVAQWLKEYSEKKFARYGISVYLPSDEELQKVVEAIAYEQYGEYQLEDCHAKMGILYEFIKAYVNSIMNNNDNINVIKRVI